MWIYVLMCVLRLVEAEEGIWSLGTKVPGDCEPLEVDAGTQALVLMIEQHIHNHGYISPAPGLLSFPVCLSDEMNWWNVQTFVTGFFYWACFQRPFVSILCPSVSEEYSVCLPSYLSGDQWMSIWLVAKNHHVQVSVWTWCSAQGGCLIRSGLAGSYGKST